MCAPSGSSHSTCHSPLRPPRSSILRASCSRLSCTALLPSLPSRGVHAVVGFVDALRRAFAATATATTCGMMASVVMCHTTSLSIATGIEFPQRRYADS